MISRVAAEAAAEEAAASPVAVAEAAATRISPAPSLTT
jgi:hypothetical protein